MGLAWAGMGGKGLDLQTGPHVGRPILDYLKSTGKFKNSDMGHCHLLKSTDDIEVF